MDPARGQGLRPAPREVAALARSLPATLRAPRDGALDIVRHPLQGFRTRLLRNLSRQHPRRVLVQGPRDLPIVHRPPRGRDRTESVRATWLAAGGNDPKTTRDRVGRGTDSPTRLLTYDRPDNGPGDSNQPETAIPAARMNRRPRDIRVRPPYPPSPRSLGCSVRAAVFDGRDATW